MNKLKAIAIFAVAIIFVAMGISIQVLSKNLKQEKADKERLWNNNMQLQAEKRTQLALIYTQQEFARVITDSLRNALDSLKIKPKQVIKVIYRTLTDIDTVNHTVFVDYRKTHWQISDTGKCFTWSGMAYLSDTTLKVIRDNFEYSNQTTDYFYQFRPRKFLFIRFGKKTVKQVTVPRCGNASEKVIEIIKE